MKRRRALRLALARLYVPGALKKRKLAELARLTAGAFGLQAPVLDGLPWRRRLLAYGNFTREAAERALGAGSGAEAREALEQRLYEAALPLGRELGRELGVASLPQAMAAARVLYRCLGIDFRGGPGGAVVVRRCSFAALYTPEVCALVSGLDRGILAGLAGAGTLRFEQRLTEGAGCCTARFEREAAV